jgi:transposase
MKYTRELLAEAVRDASTIADVLRYLHIRPTGGAHAHIKRRIVEFGIDISHFTGRGHLAGRRSARRLDPEQVLTVRDPQRKRAPGAQLTAALIATGVPAECARCGLGPQWHGEPLVLQVDHINGDYADCRAGNLRFLCPNCHSQTANFAGRGKHRSPVVPRPRPAPEGTDMTVREAANLLGCSMSHFYRLRQRLRDGPSAVESARRQHRRDAVIACAAAFPEEGPRKLAARLAGPEWGLRISHGTVSNVLRSTGLSRAAARRATATP